MYLASADPTDLKERHPSLNVVEDAQSVEAAAPDQASVAGRARPTVVTTHQDLGADELASLAAKQAAEAAAAAAALLPEEPVEKGPNGKPKRIDPKTVHVDFGEPVAEVPPIQAKVDATKSALASPDQVGKVGDVVKPGDVVKVLILSIDPRERKISLSIKAFKESEERADIETYVGEREKSTGKLGDLLSAKLKGISAKKDEE